MSFNRVVNGIGESGVCVVKGVLSSAAPAIAGGTGEWLVGNQACRGVLKGLVTSAFYHVFILPASTYLEANKGETKDKISQKAIYFYNTVGTITELVVPMLIVNYYGDSILTSLGSRLPAFVGTLITPDSSKPYSTSLGLISNVAPVIAQWFLTSVNTANSR
jgi:hypothetical protein